jgi:hypothetical protein
MYVMVTGNRETSCLARLLTLDLYVRYECRLLLHSNRAVFVNYNSVQCEKLDTFSGLWHRSQFALKLSQ